MNELEQVTAVAIELIDKAETQGVLLGYALINVAAQLAVDKPNLSVRDYMIHKCSRSWAGLSRPYNAATTANQYGLAKTEAVKLGVGVLCMISRAGSAGTEILQAARKGATYDQLRAKVEGPARNSSHITINGLRNVDKVRFVQFAQKHNLYAAEAFQMLLDIAIASSTKGKAAAAGR